MTFVANIGSLSMEEKQILAGAGPHVLADAPLAAGLGALEMGEVLARSAADEMVPFDVAQSFAAGTGDGTETDFSGELGAIVPGSFSATDGTEAFSDDGFGALAGDAGGSGKVNYATGKFTLTFNAAPANEAAVAASYKPVMRGVLSRPAGDGDDICQYCRFGKVMREFVKVGGVAATAAQIEKLAELNIWVLG